MSDSVRPHRRQPIRLRCPWDSPGKNTGVGCHFLLQCMKVKVKLCPTLWDPMDCSPPGSSIHGIFQARVLEWGAIAFSDSFCYFLSNPSFMSILDSQCWSCHFCLWKSFSPSSLVTGASPVALVVENLPVNAGDARDVGSITGSRRSAGGGNGSPLQYSCLENPMDRGAWWATVCEVAKSQAQLSGFHFHFTSMCQEWAKFPILSIHSPFTESTICSYLHSFPNAILFFCNVFFFSIPLLTIEAIFIV